MGSKCLIACRLLMDPVDQSGARWGDVTWLETDLETGSEWRSGNQSCCDNRGRFFCSHWWGNISQLLYVSIYSTWDLLWEARGGPLALFIYVTMTFSVLHCCASPKLRKQPWFHYSDVLLDGSSTVRYRWSWFKPVILRKQMFCFF